MKKKRLLSLILCFAMLAGMLGMVSFADNDYVCECPVPTAGDEPIDWAVEIMRQAHCMGIVGTELPGGVYFQHGTPRWYMAELLANFMEAFTGEDIDTVVDNWLLENTAFNPTSPM